MWKSSIKILNQKSVLYESNIMTPNHKNIKIKESKNGITSYKRVMQSVQKQ